MKALWAAVILTIVIPTPSGWAHERSPDVVRVEAGESGTYRVTATGIREGEVEVSESCALQGENLECEGMAAIRVLPSERERPLWFIEVAPDGTTLHRLESGEWLTLGQVGGMLEWFWTGLTHVMFGWDHLLFLLLLLLWVQGWKNWVRVLTGFTVGHSVVLVIGSSNTWASSRWVEALIAFSLVVLIAELLKPTRMSLGRRFPALVSVAFGCVHGLGFAGALSGWGIHSDWKPLVGFNGGVEAAQLLILAGLVGFQQLWEKRGVREIGGVWKIPVLRALGCCLVVVGVLRLKGWG